MSALLQAQAAGVNGGQTDAIGQQPDLLQDVAHFLLAQDDREFFVARWANQLQGGPVLFQGVMEEELDAAQGNGGGGARVVLDVLHPEEVLAQFLFGNAIGRLVIVLGQLADRPDIAFLGAFGHAAKLQVFQHALA